MKNLYLIILLVFGTVLLSNQNCFGQIEEDSVKVNKIFVVTTSDGTDFVGKIIKNDSKEVIVITKELGEVSIPKFQVKSIKEIDQGQLNADGEYIPNDIFSTRYFITTNALPMEKGENYVMLNIYGPEVHFGVSNNFGLGVMTTWGAIPVVISGKYSFKINDNTSFGLGLLAGTGSWILPEFGGVLPFAALTVGNRRTNFNIAAGYINVGEIGYGSLVNSPLLSIGGLARIGKKFSFVFDSFIVAPTSSSGGGALIMPGLRAQTKQNTAFQFAFGGIIVDGSAFPVPTLGWFIKI